MYQLGEIEVRFTAEQHIQLLRCGPPKWASTRLEQARDERPAIRWSVASALRTRARIRGSRLRTMGGTDGGPSLGDSPSGARTVPIRLRGVTCDASSGAGDGGDEETRTPDPLLAKEMLCRLSYVPLPRSMVGVSGLEPETSALSGQCSNQLS